MNTHSFSLLIALWAAGPAFACKCLKPDTPEKGIQAAEAVFTGRVLSARKNESTARYAVDVEFEVIMAWKGVEGKRVKVTTASLSTACGYPFREGKRYLVYAFGSQEELKTDLCTRTTEVESATKDVKVLKGFRATQSKRVLAEVKKPGEALYGEFYKTETGSVLQKILNEEKLLKYLRRPVVILKNKLVKDAPKVTSLGEEVRYEDAPAGPHLEVTTLAFSKASASLHFKYASEGVSGEADFEKVPDGWKLVRFDLVEH